MWHQFGLEFIGGRWSAYPIFFDTLEEARSYARRKMDNHEYMEIRICQYNKVVEVVR